MNIVDLFILSMVLLGAWQGYRKGLITGIINLGATLVAFMVASAQYRSLLEKVDQLFSVRALFEPVVYKATFASLQNKSGLWEEKTLDRLVELLPPELHTLIPQGGQTGFDKLPQNVSERIAHGLAGSITEWILLIVAFAVVFFVVLILVQLLAGILLKPLGIFHGAINRGGGLLFGTAGTILGLAVVAGLIAPLLNINSGTLGGLIQDGKLYSYLIQIYGFLGEGLKAWRMAPP